MADSQKLARLLRSPPEKLDFLEPLTAAERQQLAGDIEQARQAHSQHIRGAMAEALDHLPWLLRGPVKKLFGL
jgi:hypothetical protein